MGILVSFALYFVLWWLCLFIALPIGVKSAHEAGEQVEAGNEPGAPLQPKLWHKMALASVLALILLFIVRYFLASEWLINYWN